MAIEIVDLFVFLLREEEQRDAFVEVRAIVEAGLKRFDIQPRVTLNNPHSSSQ